MIFQSHFYRTEKSSSLIIQACRSVGFENPSFLQLSSSFISEREREGKRERERENYKEENAKIRDKERRSQANIRQLAVPEVKKSLKASRDEEDWAINE